MTAYRQPTTASCCWLSTGSSRARATRPATRLPAAAEAAARKAQRDGPAEQVPHVAAWREAYRAFGAKPQRTRNSLEALLRRRPPGCPG